jgi:pilus assembly protein CpaE
MRAHLTVVSPTDEFAGRLVDALGGEAKEDLDTWWDLEVLADTAKATATILARNPAVVLLGPDLETWRALAISDEIRRARPEVVSILVTEPTPDLYAKAMRAGITDILPPEASSDTIADRIVESVGRWSRLTRAAADASKRTGSVVTIVEPKGGSGKTSVIANLAVVLGQRFPGEVVIVDLDLQFGDLADTLLLEPRYSMADVAKTGAALDATTLKAFLTRREGIFVLCAPTDPADADDIPAELVSRVLDLLRQDFKWVLVDTAGGLTEHALAAVEASTDLVLLSSLDVLATKTLRKTVKILDEVGFISPRRHLVLNRADSRVGLDRSEALMELGMRRAIELPSDRIVPLSLNRGEPFVEAQPRSQVARRIADLAEELVTVQAASEEWGKRS